MTYNYDVSIIIVNYKTSSLIVDSLKSVIELTHGITYEVIVVDNNSEKDFREKIVSSIGDYPYFHYMALDENVGFGKANNAALKRARGRNIFFLNPDTILLNNAVKILSDFLDNNASAGGCGGNLFDGERNPAQSFRRFLPGIFWEFNEVFHQIPFKLRFSGNEYFNYSGKPLKVGFISGADLMVKRKVIETVGSFSPEFFMYFEETDLCARIKKAGWDIYSVPEAEIIHLEGGSLGNKDFTNERKIMMMEESRHKYYKRNHGLFSGKISNLLYEVFLRSREMLCKGEKREFYTSHMKYFKENK